MRVPDDRAVPIKCLGNRKGRKSIPLLLDVIAEGIVPYDNKVARIAWAVLFYEETYRATYTPPLITDAVHVRRYAFQGGSTTTPQGIDNGNERHHQLSQTDVVSVMGNS